MALNDTIHREDGLVVEYSSGTKVWYLYIQNHRIDGPAAIFPDGSHQWYLEGTPMEFQEWKREVRKYYDTEADYLLMLLKL